mgnify:CR=1 FL=1
MLASPPSCTDVASSEFMPLSVITSVTVSDTEIAGLEADARRADVIERRPAPAHLARSARTARHRPPEPLRIQPASTTFGAISTPLARPICRCSHVMSGSRMKLANARLRFCSRQLLLRLGESMPAGEHGGSHRERGEPSRYSGSACESICAHRPSFRVCCDAHANAFARSHSDRAARRPGLSAGDGNGCRGMPAAWRGAGWAVRMRLGASRRARAPSRSVTGFAGSRGPTDRGCRRRARGRRRTGSSRFPRPRRRCRRKPKIAATRAMTKNTSA